ncbi:MAG: LysM peptidoglycan-binding domain-containing protein, partial [Deltaproteobacteria bacterium]
MRARNIAAVLAILLAGCATPAKLPESASSPAPAPVVAPMPVDNTVAPAAMGTSYVVKKGDTLYSIAKAKYGDGKQWTKIQSANPGVTPQNIKV